MYRPGGTGSALISPEPKPQARTTSGIAPQFDDSSSTTHHPIPKIDINGFDLSGMTQAVLLEPQMRSTSAFMDGSLAPLSTSLAIESPPGSPVSPVSMPEHRSNVAPREIMSSQTVCLISLG